MQKAFQFHPRGTVEGSVSRIATGVPLKSVLVEIRDASDKLALQRIGQCNFEISGRGVIRRSKDDPLELQRAFRSSRPGPFGDPTKPQSH